MQVKKKGSCTNKHVCLYLEVHLAFGCSLNDCNIAIVVFESQQTIFFTNDIQKKCFCSQFSLNFLMAASARIPGKTRHQ